MSRTPRLILLGLLLSPLACDSKPKGKYAISRETTYVTEPLDADGSVDYETALNERLRGKIKPEQNAVVLLAQAIGPKPERNAIHADVYKWLEMPAPPEKGDYLIREDKFFDRERNGDFSKFLKVCQQLRTTPWKATDHPRHVEWLKANEKPLALAVEASKRPAYFQPVVSRDSNGERGMLAGPHIVISIQSREFADLLSRRAMMRLGEGDADGAWQDVLTIHRLARLLSSNNSVLIQLSGMATEWTTIYAALAVLEHTSPTAKQLGRFRSDLLKLPARGNSAVILGQSERFIFLDLLQRVASGKLKDEEVDPNAKWDDAFRTANRWFDRLEQAAKADSYSARKVALEKVETDMLSQNTSEERAAAISLGPTAQSVLMLVPGAAKRIDETLTRAEQLERNLEIAFTLAAFHADENSYPKTLAELAPKYIAELPDDLFSGKPLRYRRTTKGYKLWSVGPNGQDDCDKDDSLGRSDDIAFELPLKSADR